MSKVQIEIPDDRWFRGEWQFKPQDKQLCVIIPKEYITEIGMYDERHDRFLRVNTTSTVRELFGNRNITPHGFILRMLIVGNLLGFRKV